MMTPPRILCADDSEPDRKLLGAILASQGYDVVMAKDGKEALEIVRTRAVDLVVLDVMMPELDGFQVCALIKGDKKLGDIPVVMVTALDSRESRVKSIESGAEDFISKPFDKTEVLARVRMLLKVKDLHERLLREQFRILVECAPDAIFIESGGRFAYVNAAAAKLFGADSTGRLLQAPTTDVLPADAYSQIVERIERRPDAYKHSPLTEHSVRRLDGTTADIEANAARFTYDGQDGILFFARDITEKKTLERRLSITQKMESIGSLASGIAHELNTPIQYIGDNLYFLNDAFDGMMDILTLCEQHVMDMKKSGVCNNTLMELEEKLEGFNVDFIRTEGASALAQSLEGVGRVSSIVQAIKKYTHPGSDEKTTLNMNDAVENTVLVARNEWKYVAEVVTDLDRSLPPVPCYTGDINQVLLNILVNAAHSIAEKREKAGTPEKGRITITTSRDEKHLLVSIADTGCGIPEPNKSKVFDPFFTTKEAGKGTGQGLAIAHRIIVGKHNGTLDFTSQPGAGTTFYIRVPFDTGDTITQ